MKKIFLICFCLVSLCTTGLCKNIHTATMSKDWNLICQNPSGTYYYEAFTLVPKNTPPKDIVILETKVAGYFTKDDFKPANMVVMEVLLNTTENTYNITHIQLLEEKQGKVIKKEKVKQKFYLVPKNTFMADLMEKAHGFVKTAQGNEVK